MIRNFAEVSLKSLARKNQPLQIKYTITSQYLEKLKQYSVNHIKIF